MLVVGNISVMIASNTNALNAMQKSHVLVSSIMTSAMNV